jgi:hypothetical protein
MSHKNTATKLLRVSLLIGFGVTPALLGCSAPLEGDEGEPVAADGLELSVLPKGQVAVSEASDSSPVSLFTSWGWLYYRAPGSTEPMELFATPSSYPKGLAAVRTPRVCRGEICSGASPHQCVAWLEGANVRSRCESALLGWGGTTTISPTTVEGGEIRRLVGVSDPVAKLPALVALNTANKVLVNWYQSGGWTGWCVARTLSFSDANDLAAYQVPSGSVTYVLNRTLSSPTRTAFYKSTTAPLACDNALGNPATALTTSVAPTSRLAATPGALFALDAQGAIVQFWDTAPTQPLVTVAPKPFQSFAHRLIDNQIDELYAQAGDGSVWESRHLRVVDSAFHREWTEVP